MKDLILKLSLLSACISPMGWGFALEEKGEVGLQEVEFVAWEDERDPDSNGLYPSSGRSVQRSSSISLQGEGALTPERMYRYRQNVDEHVWYFRGEYLLWKVREGELDYLLSHAQTAPGTNTGAIGRLQEASFDWASGLRVAAGVVFSPDYWTLEGQYTWIKPTGEDTVYAGNANPLQATYNQNNSGAIQNAHSRIHLDYQLGELVLAKRFLLSNQIICRFHSGLIGAWIEQDWNVYYKGSNPSGHIHQTWEFEGGGLQVGIGGDWFFGSGLSLMGQARGALLYGAYENQLHNTSGSILVEDPKYHDHRVVSTLQILLGPSWGRVFRNWGVNLAVGYELNVWFNLQEVLRSAPSTAGNNGRDSRHSNANVALQGFTFRMQVDF